MNDVSKTTSLFMSIMKDQPLSLALVFMNVCLLALFWYVVHTATEVRKSEMASIFAANKEVNTLLASCIDPSKLPRER